MKGEFKELLLGLLAEHNQHLGSLIAIAANPELADEVEEEPPQKVLSDDAFYRIRTKIGTKIWCVTHINKVSGQVVYARLEDEESGERMEFTR